MKPLGAVFKAALESQEYRQTAFVSMTVGGTDFNFCLWSSSIYYNNVLYSSRAMSLGDFSSSAAAVTETVVLDIDDVDRLLYSTFGGIDLDSAPIRITWVILDDVSKVLDTLVIFSGFIDEWNYRTGAISLTCTGIVSQWARVTTRQYSESCRWREFKGTECAYSGSGVDCDRTYSQCEAYENEVNFGGFPWLPSMVNKRLEV
jgi:hypothetical protein